MEKDLQWILGGFEKTEELLVTNYIKRLAAKRRRILKRRKSWN